MKSFAAPGRYAVAIATLAFGALLVGGTIVAGRIVADNLQGPVDQAALLAPHIIDDYRRAGAAFPDTLVQRDLRQMGVHVDVRQPPPAGEGPPPPPPPPPPRQGPGGIGPGAPDAKLRIAMTLFGLHPREVRNGSVSLLIAPEGERVIRAFYTFIATLAALIAIYVGAVILIGRAASEAALRPLHETTRALRDLAGGNFVPRMIVADESLPTAALAHAYNAAAEHVAAAIEERRNAEVEMRRFLADAGHELRTPLTIVSGYLDLLGNGSSDPAMMIRIVTGMREETSRMRALVEKLLLLVRLESTQAQTATVDVVGIAASVVQRLSLVAGSRAIDLEAPAAAHVNADESDLYEAMFNLVDNAIKYGAASDVSVRISAEREGVAITVHDGGPGLDAEEQRHAFERFYRGQQRAQIEGSGLGLAIVKRAVERCGGTISLASRAGQGATFTIMLPRTGAALA